MIRLVFNNADATPKTTVIECIPASVPSIMDWYGAFHAGDRYTVATDGRNVPMDENGGAIGWVELGGGAGMTQNRSTAVMQRRVEPHDSLDDFPTPPWATRALFDHLINRLWWPHVCMQSVREPCANRGHMVKPLQEWFAHVEASDIFDYGAGYPVQDYLFGPLPDRTDWTVMNPPFRLAEQFICRALECSDMVAMIVRTAFLEGVGRHNSLFNVRRPRLVLQFSERVVMHKGKLSAKGSTATAYCWIVWDAKASRNQPTEFDWIAPCRKRLERPEDYEGY